MKKKTLQALLIYPTCVEYLVISYAKFSLLALLYEVEKDLCADHSHPSVSATLTWQQQLNRLPDCDQIWYRSYLQ